VESNPQSALGHINRGIAAHRGGDDQQAQRHFADALLSDPSSELGWLWFAEVENDPAKKRYCLDRAWQINPDTAGNEKRNLLSGISPKIPQEISDLEHPPLPPSFCEPPSSSGVIPRIQIRRVRPTRKRVSASPPKPATTTKPSVRKTWIWIGISVFVALVVAVAAAVGFWSTRDKGPEYFIAVVGPMTGPERNVGEQMVRGAQISLNMYNRAAKGHRLGMLVFDDQDDPKLAVDRAKEIVADDRILAVIGHGTSATSLAAAPIYEEAGIAAITGQATADALSQYPAYFRTIFPTSTEGSLLAVYIQQVLNFDTISVVVGPVFTNSHCTARYRMTSPPQARSSIRGSSAQRTTRHRSRRSWMGSLRILTLE